MKLLLDENLSRRLVERLRPYFDQIDHVAMLGMERASDESIWEYAKARSLVIVSKDSDFHQRSFALGHPPKVVWLRLGNCTTEQACETPIHAADALRMFERDRAASFLIVPS